MRKIWKNKHPQAQLIIYCKQIADDLAEYGCVPRKTNKIRFNQLSDNLKPHGLLGYFDGDGSWYVGKKKVIINGAYYRIRNFVMIL